jgi:hypothetical protein
MGNVIVESGFLDAANSWAAAGMNFMLSGQPNDVNVDKMLVELRQQ